MADPRQLEPEDSMVTRRREERTQNFWMYIVPAVTGPPLLMAAVSWGLLDRWKEGLFLGLIISTIVVSKTIHRFIIQVGPARGFVTLDQLRNTRSYVPYGPGLHFSKPQEKREARNNISLEEGSEDFQVTVRAQDGFLTVRGSIRMRPDIGRMVPFITGVASLASEVTALLRAFLSDIMSGETIDTATSGVQRINGLLSAAFANGPRRTDFEERFGVVVGDVTIEEILPSADVQATLSGLFEADVIARGTSRLLGHGDDVVTARVAVSEEEWRRAQDRFMAASKNLTMNLDANEYVIDIRGLENLDPETARAIMAGASRVFTGTTVRGGRGRGGAPRTPATPPVASPPAPGASTSSPALPAPPDPDPPLC
ncbi:hypothetical protein HY416_01040 [Candidatus Kaiserbacteria bacterium]|nr:hypothetical protein [Candidatus Kaiserbacteria bacterium]